jgi:hypothetical protein
MDDNVYYAQLEAGARYLASRAATPAERIEHLGWANRYYRLKADALETARLTTIKQAA